MLAGTARRVTAGLVGFGTLSRLVNSAGKKNVMVFSAASPVVMATGAVMEIGVGVFMETGAVMAIPADPSFCGVPNTPIYSARRRKGALVLPV